MPYNLEAKITKGKVEPNHAMDKIRINLSFPHPIQKVLSFNNSSKGATTRPIACLPSGEEQAEAKVQERDEPVETLAKNDVELC